MPKEKQSAISNQTSAGRNQQAGLKWNSVGSLVDVPARDLTDAEVLEYGGYEKLIASGCYEAIDNTEMITPSRSPIERGETLIGERSDIERLLNRDSEE